MLDLTPEQRAERRKVRSVRNKLEGKVFSGRRLPDNHNLKQLLRKYKLTPLGYSLRLADQGGVCAVCGEPPKKGRLHVDHCHETGKVRGLLCQSCNVALGYAGDNWYQLMRLAAYILER